LYLKVGNSKYDFEQSEVHGGLKFTSEVSFLMALDLLSRREPTFLKSFLHVLTNSVHYEAYFFETPPMTAKKVLPVPLIFVYI
jgi:hypothetical protein